MSEAMLEEKPTRSKKRNGISKYDLVKVKVWIGENMDHHYILSRFLISRMLTVTRIPYVKAVKIALDVKKYLVDNSYLDIRQEELEQLLFQMMRERGFDDEYIHCYQMVTQFMQQRQPLIILIGGTAFTGKSTIAQQLASRLNLPNVMQTDIIYQLLRTSEEVVMGKPLWEQGDISSEAAVEEFRRQCVLVRKGLDGDFNKTMKDGKPLIVEGMHLDPSMYLEEFHKLGIVMMPGQPEELPGVPSVEPPATGSLRVPSRLLSARLSFRPSRFDPSMFKLPPLSSAHSNVMLVQRCISFDEKALQRVREEVEKLEAEEAGGLGDVKGPSQARSLSSRVTRMRYDSPLRGRKATSVGMISGGSSIPDDDAVSDRSTTQSYGSSPTRPSRTSASSPAYPLCSATPPASVSPPPETQGSPNPQLIASLETRLAQLATTMSAPASTIRQATHHHTSLFRDLPPFDSQTLPHPSRPALDPLRAPLRPLGTQNSTEPAPDPTASPHARSTPSPTPPPQHFTHCLPYHHDIFPPPIPENSPLDPSADPLLSHTASQTDSPRFVNRSSRRISFHIPLSPSFNTPATNSLPSPATNSLPSPASNNSNSKPHTAPTSSTQPPSPSLPDPQPTPQPPPNCAGPAASTTPSSLPTAPPTTSPVLSTAPPSAAFPSTSCNTDPSPRPPHPPQSPFTLPTPAPTAPTSTSPTEVSNPAPNVSTHPALPAPQLPLQTHGLSTSTTNSMGSNPSLIERTSSESAFPSPFFPIPSHPAPPSQPDPASNPSNPPPDHRSPFENHSDPPSSVPTTSASSSSTNTTTPTPQASLPHTLDHPQAPSNPPPPQRPPPPLRRTPPPSDEPLRPLFVPIILHMPDHDLRMVAEEKLRNHLSVHSETNRDARDTRRGTRDASDSGSETFQDPFEQQLSQVQLVQDYLCACEAYGLPIVDVHYGNFGAALEEIHEYVLKCIEVAMEGVVEEAGS